MTFTYNDSLNTVVNSVYTGTDAVFFPAGVVAVAEDFLSSSSSGIASISFMNGSNLRILGPYCFAYSSSLNCVDLTP